MNIRIEELNAENWYECCHLTLTEDQQQYMESNAISIAQSKFELSLKPFAIYAEEQIVGFLMYNSELEELGSYWIYRIMVDKEHQGKGIGKTATILMIEDLVKTFNADKIAVGYHPENTGAHALYQSLGFVDNGNRFGKEMAVVKTITT